MLEKGKVVFGNWTVEETIGSGAFGTVYKIKREEFGKAFYAAMKVLEIPHDKEEHNRLRREGMDDASISTYYSQIAQDFIKEIELLSSLDGITNIVDYKDHIIVPNEGLGYTIYIKMQLLTPITNTLLNSDGSVRFMDAEEVIKLGKDMCSALEVCEKKKIIHRDIKIDNIFLSENGDYKLGDFGIARQMEATQGEMSKKGTLMYMAPEVFKGEKYDKTADIYSLGIVLYRLLNKNRAPFFPDYPQPIKFTDKEEANNRRLSGEVVPSVKGISDELNAVLKKACAYNPRDRYQSASEFKAALELVETAVAAPVIVAPETPAVVEIEEKTKSVFAPATENTADEATVGMFGTIPVPHIAPVFPAAPVAENTVDEDATVGVFNSTPIASVEPVAPVAEDTMEEEKTESVFGNEREAILSDSFYEKETVTLESFDEEKTESAFTPAFVAENTVDEDATVGVFGTTPIVSVEAEAPVVEDTMEDEKTESVFAPVVDEKKVESAASAKENTPKKSNKGSIIAIISVIVVIAIIAGIIGLVGSRDNSGSDVHSGDDVITTEVAQSSDDDDNLVGNIDNVTEASETTEAIVNDSTEVTIAGTQRPSQTPTQAPSNDDYYEDDTENRIYYGYWTDEPWGDVSYIFANCNITIKHSYVYWDNDVGYVTDIETDDYRCDEDGYYYVLPGDDITVYISVKADDYLDRVFYCYHTDETGQSLDVYYGIDEMLEEFDVTQAELMSLSPNDAITLYNYYYDCNVVVNFNSYWDEDSYKTYSFTDVGFF